MAGSCVRRSVLSLSRFRCSGVHATRSSPGRGTIRPEKRSACWVNLSRHESFTRNFHNTQRRGGGGGGVLWAAVAFSLFSSTDEDQRDEAQRKEDDMILLLKKAKMANLAYVQGQLDNAEKLFKAAMSFMLSGGMPQDDNAIIEMSLKLATIYAEQNKVELVEHGFRFCTESLEAKLQKQEETPAEERTEEEEALRKETRLLLGLCLDSRARYRASKLHLNQAGQDYQNALNICRQEQGDTHPQTLVLMSDLATVLDLQGRHDDALALVQQAVDLSRSVGHPDQHVLLGNMAGILLHTGRLEDSVQFYHEALSLARQAGDQEAVEQIQEGLKEVKKRRNQESKEEEERKEEEAAAQE
ncbi:tetratricopeptide repeat protein 19, mitochondrial isoform X3 [Epinephelus lanceolatus]|uniref:tetratricopeptide repeat protein 19, mitochondrial isoform X4 n=1 Tax=Epinephelus lanceolatus TaxID=310571 RepID=UPI001446E6BA|nr:tetratricopeptide repeat protein 19, mitochondrial isoform X4 [Epinephelus lanceolatus]